MKTCPIVSRPRLAFTLTELLVIIAIVAILAAILIPVGNSVIERGRVVKRMENMRALGSASLLYATDNGGKLPFLCTITESAWSSPLWHQELGEYISAKMTQATFYNGVTREGKDMLICPLVPEGDHVGCDYAANSAIFYIPTEAPDGQVCKIASISNPESVALIVSSENRANGNPSWYVNAHYYVNYPTASSNLPSGKWTSDPFIAAVFADGHYEEIDVDDFEENRERYLIPQNLIDANW